MKKSIRNSYAGSHAPAVVVDADRVARLAEQLLEQPGVTIQTTSVEECAAVLAEVRRRGGKHCLVEDRRSIERHGINAPFRFVVTGPGPRDDGVSESGAV